MLAGVYICVYGGCERVGGKERFSGNSVQSVREEVSVVWCARLNCIK